MLFSSITFIFYFLTSLLLIYYIVPKKFKNSILLIYSLLFYFFGEPKYIIILILSCVINYVLSLLIEKGKLRKFLLVIAVIYNIGQLLFFKYTDFFIENINSIFNSDIGLLKVVMPIGISFFTFQALGYVIDVYRKKHKPANNLWTFMTYVCLFPQLVAGPIVRYSDVEEELVKREHSVDKFAGGIKRFVIGLSKKVLLANVLGEYVGSLVMESVLSSWVKPVLFTLQLYFDFSGYSDMAIGLGLMFGFRFLENFNYPLIASSITDFWRRWHMSLGSWFRDYVYIPLGGNRVSKLKLFRNIFIVWFLTGFWHGAAWNFIIWGLYFAVILIIEKFVLKKYLDKTHLIKYIYSLLLIIIGFLIFNSGSVNEILSSLKNMFFLSNIPLTDSITLFYFKNYIVLFIVAIILSTPLVKVVVDKLKETKVKGIVEVIEMVVIMALLILCVSFLIDASFNPFLYFRF